MNEPARFATAGAVAAIVWALAEPVDRRIFRSDYSDVAVLGKFVTTGRGWRPDRPRCCTRRTARAFGLAYREAKRRRGWSALRLAMLEHLALYPLSALVDRRHPARGSAGIPKLLTPRAFAQATVRHAVFGAALGRLA